MSNLGTITESGLSSARSSPEHFSYPGAQADNDSDDEFVYPGTEEAPSTSSKEEQVEEVAQPPPQPRPSPAQLESLCAAASSGDLPLLKKLFRNALDAGDVEAFSLANDASTRTGYTALHAAANKGHLNVIKWLVEECGAMPDLEDKEGETAVHKAALNGYLHIIEYLLPDKADVHARDADGWTALHNACSKGYLDIVRWLCEKGGAASDSNGVRGVDKRSKGGWTPLMNAASKGHLPVVHYLLNKQAADPLIRNNWGETAFDAAAGVFEVWICEILQRAEAERWSDSPVPYNPLSVHTTVPIVLYENQKLDTRIKTLAVSGGRPKFSASGLGKQGRRAPFEVRLPNANGGTTDKLVPAWRSDVQLPLRESPWTLPIPGSTHLEGCERSHFWLSDWTLDVTQPNVDAEEGWQYAHRFTDQDESWTAEMPPPLQRIVSGGVTLSPGLGGTSSRRSPHPQPTTWVRRRRWVRVMRRRLDIPPLPFLLPDGGMYSINDEGNLVPYTEEPHSSSGDEEGQELGAISSNFLSSTQDYVSRARYLVGKQSDWQNAASSAVEARRAIAKLERATMELGQGILGDEDVERKTQAEVLLNAYGRELERRRLAASAQGLLISGDDDYVEDNGDDSDDEFHYPGSSPRDSMISSQRVCQKCFSEVNGTIPSPFHGMRNASMERVFIDQERLTVPSHPNRGQSGSQLSDLAECPVCNRNLDQLGGAAEQEAHVKTCLEGGSSTTPQTAKYLVYVLPSESALIGSECVICLEEFAKGKIESFSGWDILVTVAFSASIMPASRLGCNAAKAAPSTLVKALIIAQSSSGSQLHVIYNYYADRYIRETFLHLE
ncbi:hypothetical protein AAF712_002094 [Marasmius tenuissimus]|uniref:Uncharacterized protein n=1 Tax=Marasmius tenuissimus TaxID=585030 RepID=A0ABR3AB03_9AGAR